MRLDTSGNLGTAYTKYAESYPVSADEPNGYTRIRIFKNGNVRLVDGQLFGDDTPTTPVAIRSRKDLHFSLGTRDYTIGHLSDSRTSGLNLQYVTPINLEPGVYSIDDNNLKREISNAKIRARNAMNVIGFSPGLWRRSFKQLIVDNNEKPTLSYKLIIMSPGIKDLRQNIKKHAEENEIIPLKSPSRPTPRRLF